MFLIVGAGLAGAKAAETLRDEGYEGPLTLIGAEHERPYERPPLSKGFLSGKDARDSIFVHDAGWYRDHDVDLRTGVTVTRLEPSAHEIVLAGGPRLQYDKLLLTTGSSPRGLSIPGAELDGVGYLRQVEDAEALLADLSGGGKKVVVVGGGWIGLEFAAAARTHGNDVTLIEPQNTVLRAALGQELGDIFAALHRENGVDLRLNTGVRALNGTAGRVTSVLTDAGDELPADLVLVGVGVQPNVQLAKDAGLTVDNGILTDQWLRSSDPDIFAAGDVANYFHPLFGYHMRVEHWANALNGGPAAARSMLGQTIPYDRIPYFFTDQYDLGMEYSGHVGPEGYDQVVYRGNQAGREFIAFWLKDGRVLAGMNVNVWDVTDPIQALVRSKAQVDPGRLADPDVPFGELLPG